MKTQKTINTRLNQINYIIDQLKETREIKDYLQELKILKKRRSDAESRKIPLIDDNTGKFLEIICYLAKPKKILEIGCGIGYSTFFLLKHFRKMIQKTAFKNDNSFKRKSDNEEFNNGNINKNKNNAIYSYTGIDLNRDRISEAKKFICNMFSDLENCEIFELKFIHGNAIKEIPKLWDRFDLVFIDAAKYEYPDYARSLLKKLNPNCMVIADNILYSNKLFKRNISRHDCNSVRGLREYIIFITDNSLFNSTFFNIGDGIVLSEYIEKVAE